MADLHTTLVEFDIVVGQPIVLSPLIRRITAPNASDYTGPGTNTYLVGHGDDVAVIDPGPDDTAHIAAILAATNHRIRWLVVTHTHPDHSPAAKQLQDATGAQMIGMPVIDGTLEFLDDTFRFERPLCDGDRLITDSYSLCAIHTPGHVSNHMSFLLEQEDVLFAGDHIMQGATVVIASIHGGTMWDYLASLDKLKGLGLKWLAPAHGHILTNCDQVVTELKAHRLVREQRSLEALQLIKRGRTDDLLPLVYPDIGDNLADAARTALLAHMEKLVHDSLVRRLGEPYCLLGQELWEIGG